MKVLVTGATGLIGRELCHELLSRGHQVAITSRDPAKGAASFGGKVEAHGWDALGGDFPAAALAGAAAIVHLAGEPIAESYWTASVRKRIRSSRSQGTAALARAIRAGGARPQALVCASAVGLYGDRGDEELTEDSAPGKGFLAEVCKDWEHASAETGSLCARQVTIRIGLVLSAKGGLLARMLPPFRLGLGAVFGNGSNWMSWIHQRDLVRLLAAAVEDPRFSGTINGVAPNPVRQSEFAETIAKAVRRPLFFKVPSPVLRLALGAMSELVLGSQRASAVKALGAGFEFEHPALGPAMEELVVRR
jgi:uncharacterized protein